MTSLRTHWSTGPVMPLAVPPPIPLPEAVPFRELIGRVPPAKRSHVLDAIADTVAEDFATKMTAAWDSLGFVRAEPYSRLQSYLEKPQATWQEQSAKYPRDYDEDWSDFARLRERATTGDFDPRDGGLLRTQSLMYERVHNL